MADPFFNLSESFLDIFRKQVQDWLKENLPQGKLVGSLASAWGFDNPLKPKKHGKRVKSDVDVSLPLPFPWKTLNLDAFEELVEDFWEKFDYELSILFMDID